MKTLTILLIFISLNAFSHGEGGDVKVGKGFAVEEYSKEKGFKLSAKALDRLKLKYVSKISEIPENAKIKSLKGTNVYIRSRDYFKLVALKGLELKAEDKVVANKVLLLKNIDSEAASSLKHHDEEHHHEHEDESEHKH